MPYQITLLVAGESRTNQKNTGTALVDGENLTPILEFLRHAWVSEECSFEVSYVS